MTNTAIKQTEYTVERDFADILSGKAPLPNVKDEDAARFLNNLAASGRCLTPHWGWANIDGRKNWAYFFLRPAGMGGRLDGSAYVVVYGTGNARVVSMAICRHEKADAPGADHRRGWHPGSCKHCGLDMTVDSGD